MSLWKRAMIYLSLSHKRCISEKVVGDTPVAEDVAACNEQFGVKREVGTPEQIE